jgi:lysophospholipase L1-like esterase
MLDCLILGDSIAVGVAQFRPECEVHAKVGINSRNYVDKNITKDLSAKTVVISLGSNDPKNMKTLGELFAMRQVIDAKQVYWIVPAVNVEAQEAVKIVADKFQDKILFITQLSKDKIHPTTNAYKELANNIK